MKNIFSKYLSFAVCVLLLASCKNEEVFDNNVFISTPKVETILIKPSVLSDSRILQISIARAESNDIAVDFAVDQSLVSKFNLAYGETAILLPSNHYKMSSMNSVIPTGSVLSNPIDVNFLAINTLDRDITYVLPVRVSNSNLNVLQSGSITYYLIKAGALINVVADIENNYLNAATLANASALNNLSEVTLEALVYPRNFDRMISTVMGIEGKFLIRLGDAGYDADKIQIATSTGNLSTTAVLTPNKWTHIAVTYNRVEGTIKVYLDGKLNTSGRNTTLGLVNLGMSGSSGFYIGRSWEDVRFFAGDVSECRIWNVERSEEQIASNFYDIDPTTEGLVAYWKCNEGGGSIVNDHTTNGNHLTAKSLLKWNAVSLPESN
ncbi:DUF1735 and LamG domain-containing protein [Sphingobacterium hungaricum]|uniref:BT-3987-like N-terminal domain-containing protein n=1 Tax=Sphingobacterium hungaricum TaxID=2082723 RepID=A0A928YP20_9SPHI|nr:DUF1735 and LamG domain-containing protein [Sphingobacterium hungaricum]MBE8712469.1 hypothetical protein [Sphingobacterium hungaricum]